MDNLSVYIEIKGKSVLVGKISGNSSADAQFSYLDEYLSEPQSNPISISLPLQEEPFSPSKTRNFFDGLLPEGFMRSAISKNLRTSIDDYISVLTLLGQECLGALKIIKEGAKIQKPKYRRLSNAQMVALAEEGASKSASLVVNSHLSLTGASGKVGLYYDKQNNLWYQPYGEAPSTHIVKQSHVRFEKIVANELLCLKAAKKLGIKVVGSFIVNEKTQNDTQLYATERYDRKFSPDSQKIDGLYAPLRLHQEDFAQALGISSADKYEPEDAHYLQKLFSIIKSYSTFPFEDQLRLWDICIFNCLIGNADNHIKNLSLLYDEKLQTVRLAPAYDIVSTRIYKNTSSKMGLSIDGEFDLNKITRQSFAAEADAVGLGSAIALEHFDNMNSKFEEVLIESAKELESEGIQKVSQIAYSILDRR